MMTRKERRAAEHTARKTARKAGCPQPEITTAVDAAAAPIDQTEPAIAPNPPIPAKEISEAQLAANRANAQHSTGPTSAAGKAKVSTNAVKTALTGRTILLPFDDVDAYQTLLNDYIKAFLPAGPIEKGLVQSLVDTVWRLERIPGLEYALVENGYNQIGHENPQLALNTPKASLELHIRRLYEKGFRNLQLQESRLVRRREKEMKELRALQEARKAEEAQELQQAAQAALVAERNQQPFDLTTLGFEFSTERFTQHMARLTPAMKQELLQSALPKAAAA